MPRAGGTRPPFLSVALISAAALSYEILLMRLFSISQWHHFAWMIISLALLGYGASGTFISLARQWLLPRFNTVFPLTLLLFGIASVGCYLVARQVPFNAEEILWEWRQSLYLLALYLLAFGEQALGRILRVDPRTLVGAGLLAAVVAAAGIRRWWWHLTPPSIPRTR